MKYQMGEESEGSERGITGCLRGEGEGERREGEGETRGVQDGRKRILGSFFYPHSADVVLCNDCCSIVARAA